MNANEMLAVGVTFYAFAGKVNSRHIFEATVTECRDDSEWVTAVIVDHNGRRSLDKRIGERRMVRKDAFRVNLGNNLCTVFAAS